MELCFQLHWVKDISSFLYRFKYILFSQMQVVHVFLLLFKGKGALWDKQNLMPLWTQWWVLESECGPVMKNWKSRTHRLFQQWLDDGARPRREETCKIRHAKHNVKIFTSVINNVPTKLAFFAISPCGNRKIFGGPFALIILIYSQLLFPCCWNIYWD